MTGGAWADLIVEVGEAIKSEGFSNFGFCAFFVSISGGIIVLYIICTQNMKFTVEMIKQLVD